MAGGHAGDAVGPIDVDHAPRIIQRAAPQDPCDEPVRVQGHINVVQRSIPREDAAQDRIQLSPVVIRHPAIPSAQHSHHGGAGSAGAVGPAARAAAAPAQSPGAPRRRGAHGGRG